MTLLTPPDTMRDVIIDLAGMEKVGWYDDNGWFVYGNPRLVISAYPVSRLAVNGWREMTDADRTKYGL